MSTMAYERKGKSGVSHPLEASFNMKIYSSTALGIIGVFLEIILNIYHEHRTECTNKHKSGYHVLVNDE